MTTKVAEGSTYYGKVTIVADILLSTVQPSSKHLALKIAVSELSTLQICYTCNRFKGTVDIYMARTMVYGTPFDPPMSLRFDYD